MQRRGKSKELELLEAELPAAGQTSFTRQQEPLGLGHAVWCAREIVGHEPFALLLPDMLHHGPRGCLAGMMDVYAETGGGNVIAVYEVPRDQVHQYGIVGVGETSGKGFRITSMVEKPKPADAPSNYMISGRYILQPEIFALLERADRRRRRRDSGDGRDAAGWPNRSPSSATGSKDASTTAARRSASSPPTSPTRSRATTSRRRFAPSSSSSSVGREVATVITVQRLRGNPRA